MQSSSALARPRKLVVEEIRAREARSLHSRHWFFDFGKAAFATLAFEVEAVSPVSMVVHLGEKLEGGCIDRLPPGCVRYRKVCLSLPAGRHRLRVEIPPDQRNTGPAAILMPAELFEVLPFRYAELEWQGEARLEEVSVKQLAVFYPFDESAAEFSCDHEGLNRVWDLCKYSIKATTFCAVYVDGDRERIPYEGDAYINQLCHYGVDAEYEMARHSLEYLLFHPTWPTEWQLHCVPMAWADYWYTGRDDLLREYYGVLKHKTLSVLERDDGLISTETGLVTPELLKAIYLPEASPLKDLIDWPPGSFTQGGVGERDNYDMVPVKTAVNAFYAWNLELLGRMAEVLGRQEEAEELRKKHVRVRESMQRVFFRPGRGIFVDGEGTENASLHGNMFPAAFDLLPASAKKTVGDFIRSRGMACSVYGAQYLLEGCYLLERAEDALDLMTAEHDRGWLNMLKAGSTITLEAWDHRYKNNLDWNHAWGAAPANIIPRFLVGVQPGEPGFARVSIRPQPGWLKRFSARVPTPRGGVRVELDGTKLRVETPVPARLDLSAWMNGDGAVMELGPGRREISLDGA